MMKIEAATALAAVVGTLILGSATAWVAVRSARVSMADKMLGAMKDEAALLAELAEASAAHQQLQDHLEWMTKRYVSERSIQTQVKIEYTPVVGSLVLGSLMSALGIWALMAGSWALLWLLLALPLVLICVYGFFFEVTGGESRQRLMRNAQQPPE